MAVTIIRKKTSQKPPPCANCGGTGTKSHVVESMGKKATMTLPCVVCRPIVRIPYLNLHAMPLIASKDDQILDSLGLKK